VKASAADRIVAGMASSREHLNKSLAPQAFMTVRAERGETLECVIWCLTIAAPGELTSKAPSAAKWKLTLQVERRGNPQSTFERIYDPIEWAIGSAKVIHAVSVELARWRRNERGWPLASEFNDLVEEVTAK